MPRREPNLPEPSDADLVRAWREAVRDPRVVEELNRVEGAIADAVAQRGPACWGSGRCCGFEAAGHRLYVTGLEAAFTLARLPGTAWSRADAPRESGVTLTVAGSPERAATPPGGRTLRVDDVDAARRAGGCPFQISNTCGVHPARPTGCRVYFCDRSAQDWQHDLAEHAVGLVRAIHDRFEIEYRYAEWRSLLTMFAQGSGNVPPGN